MLYTPPVGNQVKPGPCVGFAVGYAAASILAYPKYGNWDAALRSPAYVYNQVRVDESCDSGACISDALRLLKSQGVCSYRSMPYVVDGCHTLPSQQQRAEALRNRILHWGQLAIHTDTLRWALSLGYPVVLAIKCTPAYFAMQSRGGVWKSSGNSTWEELHAVCVVGFDDAIRMFKVMNSKGEKNGDKGFFWLSYDLLPVVSIQAFMLYGMAPEPQITGPETLCTTGTYRITHLNPEDRVEWKTSPAIEIVSGQGTSTLTVRKDPSRGELGYISALVNGSGAVDMVVQVGSSTPHVRLLDSEYFGWGGSPCYRTAYRYGFHLSEGPRDAQYTWSVDWFGDESGFDSAPLASSTTGSSGVVEQMPMFNSGAYSSIRICPWGQGKYRMSCTIWDQCGAGRSSGATHSEPRCRWGDRDPIHDPLGLHPNPARSVVTLRVEEESLPAGGDLQGRGFVGRADGQRMVQIYSQQAELMLECPLSDGVQVDVSDWPRGLYTVLVDGVRAQSLVVE